VLAYADSLGYVPFRGRDAVAAGLVTRRQLAGPGWRRLFPDIYLDSSLPLDHRTWCLAAAVLVGQRGAISGRSAAYLWGADTLDRSAPVEVTVGEGQRIRPKLGLTVVHSRLTAADVAMVAGLPVTTPVRTAFDLARRRPMVEGVVSVDALRHRGLVTREQVLRYADEHPAWVGAPLVRPVVALSDAGAESPMESRTRVVLIAGGLPRPETQIEVFDSAGRFVGRIDLGYRAKRVGIEYEGDQHRSRFAFQRDLRRLNALRAAGWTVLRFGPSDIYRHSRSVVAAVRAALRS
jgi:hypothetical protein